MHGRACEERKKVRHMWTAPSRATASLKAVGSSSSVLSSPNSFFKDGRKISVGDCALFKPPKDCPPFIGIIHSLTSGKENQLKLGVNWLYRPAEVKLGKGILLEAAPNEIFYSFHKDEIPAASLLHPCKVAFLPKGVELPSGICSFVCRRVYDITSKCLWWLTDQDYIDERQEEVDQLLYKTRLEMHATLQPGGRSPKPMNGPTSTSQLKPSSDSLQNSGSSFPSQVKGKKRERVDQGSEPVKRERTAKIDDGDSGHGRLESTLKSEIAKITEKGGLVDSEGVGKLVQLMLPERNEKKIDLVSRLMLAGVVAATDKFDCLSRFVQLRGLPVLDEWLQEVHKGKIGGDGTSPKDGDKSIEEFLFVLLRALDKLPVNLHALQMCNIGKSVNHLRSHKNVEIQRKARSLVDTWKKRVEAEMDAKSGSSQGVSWPARSRLPEASSHGSMKTSVAHPHALKSSSVKLVHGESNSKPASPSPGSAKSAPSLASSGTNVKDRQQKNTVVGDVSDVPPTATRDVSDVPPTATRDEKSSSSSQSHNNSQSYSSDHANKTGGVTGKEDARSSTAGSLNVNKSSSGSSRQRKSVNGFQGSAQGAVQRETGSSRSSSFQRNNAASEKSSQTSEKAPDVPAAEGNSHKLIVKLPNRGRSPAQSTGSLEDAAAMNSIASSPVLSEKNDQADHNNDFKDVNTESWQSNDFKDVQTGSDEGGGSPSVVPDEEPCGTVDDSRKTAEVSKAASPQSENELKPGKLHVGSFSSINALIESCVKHSEVNASMAIGDDVGMNLLASVAAGEIPKSDTASPSGSPQANESDIPQNLYMDGANSETEKQHVISGAMWSNNAENRTISKPVDDVGGSLDSSSKDLKEAVNKCLESNGKSKDVVMATADVPSVSCVEKALDDDGSKEHKGIKLDGVPDSDHVSDTKLKVDSSLLTDAKVADLGMKAENEAHEQSFSHPSSEMDGGNKKEQKPSVMTSEFVKGADAASLPPVSGKDMFFGNADELKTEKADEMDTSSHCDPTEQYKTEGDSTANGNQVVARLDSSITNQKVEHVGETLESDEVKEQRFSGCSPSKVSTSFPVKEREQHGKRRESRLSGGEADDAEEESTSVARDASSVSAAGGSDTDAKVEFDLNEGFTGDDVRSGDLNNVTGPATSTPVQLISPLPLPSSVTVTAAAKRPFVPPEDLLRNKGFHGWKGSAATSAFRPAEPRKALEAPNNNSVVPSDATSRKQTRPVLDIDLNVPDERVLEDLISRSSGQVMSSVSDPMGSSAPVRPAGGLDLDLNRVDEPNDIGNNYTSNNSHHSSFQPVKQSSGSRMTDEAGGRRDFDLNNGPAIDDLNPEPSIMFRQHARSTLPSQPPSLSGIRVNSADMANFSSWFPAAADTFSSVTIPPSILPNRDHYQPFPIVASSGPQRMLGPNTMLSPFSPDLYRGPVLSSSPAVPYPSSTPFQYPVFPFGTSFPLPSATFSSGSATYVDSSSAAGRLGFPHVNPQLLGAAVAAVPSNCPRPYVVSLTDGGNSSVGGGSESGRKCFRQDLDLNTGPDAEGRNEVSYLAQRPLSASSSQTLMEEQARMFQMSGGVLKRKEPEGGWDGYKQSSWQ